MDFAEVVVNVLLFVSLYFEIFLLLAFLEKDSEGPEGPLAAFPSVAIIVPCFNEELAVARTLRSLLAQDYPAKQVEIVAVDDGSEDKTWAALQGFSSRPRVRLLRKKNGGKYTALNLGIAESRSEIVGCLDADSEAAPNALTEIIRAFQKDPELAAVTPAIKTNPPRNVLQRMQKAEYALSIFFRKALALVDGNFVTPGPFSFFKRSALESVGPYREAHNTEDLEIALRLQAKGFRIGNAPRARVYTEVPKRLSSLVRQRVRWTYGFIKNFLDYRFMAFRPKFGVLGALILPATFISVFSALFFFLLMVRSAGETTMREIARVESVGFSLGQFSFSWFSLNTRSFVFVVWIMFAIIFALILCGKRLSGERAYPNGDAALYLLLYGFIAPIWLSRAVWLAIRSKKAAWGRTDKKLDIRESESPIITAQE